MKSVDITTIIGCSNMCSYCPQDVFVKNYKSDIHELTVDKLELILKNIDSKTTMINISGYSENMFNKYIAELILLCYNSGFYVNLFTTLQGFNDSILKKLSGNVAFNYVCFHEYDGGSFNKEKFDAKVQKFIDNIEIKKSEHKFTETESGYDIVQIDNPFTRGSNNTHYKSAYKYGRLKCNFFGNNLIYHTNQILPNGDIYLCCSDWSLKHKLGNIFENHYDSDEVNAQRKEIEKLLLEDESDVLCRNCEFSTDSIEEDSN